MKFILRFRIGSNSNKNGSPITITIVDNIAIIPYARCLPWKYSISGDKYVYILSTLRNVSDLISSSEVVATEVYDNNSRKQMKGIIPLLMKDVNLLDLLAKQLISTRINEITRGCM